MKVLKSLVICLLIVTTVNGRNYYLSSHGNDSKSGIKQEQTWQSIQRISKVELKAGDSVLFHRGETFTGEIVVRQSGKIGKPIVFSAYGKGNLPIITGAVSLKNATKNALQQQVFTTQQKLLKLYVNDKKQVLARYPNIGYLTMGEGIDSIGFETTLSEPNGYWAGASIGMRTIDWVFEHRNIASFEDKKLKFTKPSIYKIEKGYGYFLQNKPELIDIEGEWYSSDKEVQILSNQNLNAQKVEGVIYNNGFVLLDGVKNIVINSLQLEKYAANGIWIQKGSGSVEILNNKIENIGYIGVLIDTLVSNVNIKNNHIKYIAGRGISGNRTTNCNIEHNTIHCVGLWPGEGISGVNGMEGIVIENQEKNHALSVASDNHIAYNDVDSTGYAGIRIDGKNSVCEFNIVKNTSLKLNDSGAIYCFGKVKNRTHNNRISNNLIVNAIGNIEATPSNGMATNGIYIDNNSTQILVDNNTIINASSTGIFVNDGAPLNILRANTIYDCSSGIGFAEWATKDSLYGCRIEKNIVICLEKDKIQQAISSITYMGPELKPGTFLNNTYINYHDGFVYSVKADVVSGQRRHDLIRLKNWQNLTANEKGSRSLDKKGTKVIYNESFVTKDIILPPGFFENLDGERLGKTVLLSPCASMVIVPIQ